MKPSGHTLKGIILSAAAMGPRLTACLLAVILVSLVLGVLPPLILQQAIDSLTAGSATAKGLLLLGLLYFGLTALSGLADSAKESYITVFGQKVTHHIRTVMAQKLSRLPASYYTTHEGGAVASLFVNDVDTIEDLFDSGIISMAADALKIISILITVFFLSPGLFLLLLMALPLLFLLTRAFQKRMLAAQVENRKAVAGTNEIIPETMHTIRTIRLTGSEEFMERRYGASIRRSFSAMEKTNFYDSIYSPIILTTSAFLIALMCILSVSGTDFTALFGMTAGTAAALIAYVDKVFSPLQSMGMEIENIQSAMAGAHRIREFLGEKEMDIPEESPKETASLPLSISHMTFAYDGDHPLFHDFSLTARAGEKITIAGRTGSGKTTLFKLICGLYEPTEGTITVFGQRPSTIPPEDRRKTFGIVSQSYPMVQGTVRDQITLGDSRITGEDIERALRLAGLYDSCMNMPEKLDTPCTEGLFSQGEFQLLAIARALVFNPPLLLLDEMTASLDSLTEKRVMAVLDRASSKRTVLSISHRLYEQQGGRIVWIGKSPAAEKKLET